MAKRLIKINDVQDAEDHLYEAAKALRQAQADHAVAVRKLSQRYVDESNIIEQQALTDMEDAVTDADNRIGELEDKLRGRALDWYSLKETYLRERGRLA